MNPLPLDKILLNRQSHKSELWWLGLLYRKPDQYRENVKVLKKQPQQEQGFYSFFTSSLTSFS